MQALRAYFEHDLGERQNPRPAWGASFGSTPKHGYGFIKPDDGNWP